MEIRLHYATVPLRAYGDKAFNNNFPRLFPIGLLRFYCQVMVYSKVSCNRCFDFYKCLYIDADLCSLFFGIVVLLIGQNHSISMPLSRPYLSLQFMSSSSEENKGQVQFSCRCVVFPVGGGTWKSCLRQVEAY